MKLSSILLTLLIGISLLSCSRDMTVIEPEEDPVGGGGYDGDILGVYILNEGNMGSNKATLDFYDYNEGVYYRNIYADANPNVIKEMGDVGNDILIYGNKMYVVINASNKLEVLNAYTVEKIKSIDIPNGRSLAAHNGKIYMSSYDGPIKIDPQAPLGKVYEIDTLSLSIERETVVGYQPEELAVVGNHLYVANSGGYRVPDYDRTISVIDLNNFEEIDQIDVAENLNKLQADEAGSLWVTSRGDYYGSTSNLYKVNPESQEIEVDFGVPMGDFVQHDHTIYFYANEFNYNTYTYQKSFGMIDMQTNELLPDQFVDQQYLDEIETPYGLAINPENGDIFLTDAGNYVSTGFVYCFNKNGKLEWKTKGGNIPAHFAFLYKKN